MKLVITGNQCGIGKAIFDVFSERGIECVGFDILTGKDVSNPTVIQEIVSECKDADIFVNNALPNQQNILQNVHQSWIGQEKYIVNLSSAVTYFYQNHNVPTDFNGYFQSKQSLNELCKLLQVAGLPHILNIRPSWVDTALVSDVNCAKMNPRDLAELIYTLVTNKSPIKFLDMVVR